MTVQRYTNNVGQVPGQLYNARVVDQAGNGLYAGFFYLDADGKQIMTDTFTDNAGYFHFTVPDYNHENIFVQFYATDDYTPVVKTFTEIVDNPQIVLTKKSGSHLPLLLLAAGIGTYALTSRPKVGSIKSQWNSFKSNPRNVKIGGAVVLIGAGAVALYFIFKYKPTAAQKTFLANAKARLEYLAKELGIVPSLTTTQYATLALQIARAVDKCGTDMEAIERAFMSLNNEADFWQLTLSFGIAKYDGCFEGNLPNWNVHYTLPEALASDLSNSEILTVNNILYDKAINVRF
jgi:hypothetical protein